MVAGGAQDWPDPSIRRLNSAFGVTRRSVFGSVVPQPPSRPERDLIRACWPPGPSQYRPSSASHIGQQLTATSEGAERVTTSDTCRSRDVVEVVLGVDTHLDFHVAVALDQLGRPLGELKVSTTTRGYRRLVSWAEGFGPRKMCRSGRDRQLWCRSRSSPERRGDPGDGG